MEYGWNQLVLVDLGSSEARILLSRNASVPTSIPIEPPGTSDQTKTNALTLSDNFLKPDENSSIVKPGRKFRKRYKKKDEDDDNIMVNMDYI
jgi:hypothetical protein